MTLDSAAEIYRRAAQILDAEFSGLPKFAARALDAGRMTEVLETVAHRLGENYPYFHPLYAGQMLKPPHPVAAAAYALAMTINPNNHARDGGRASSAMEIEAVREIAGMFGWTEFLGHLTSGGTMANLEALWVAGELAPGKRVLASEQAHYTHNRISHVLKLGFGAVAADCRGRMRLDALEDELKKGDVGTVVATLGTTAIGAVDPLPGILELRDRYGFRVHVDAAYGGYFRLIAEELGQEARGAFEAIDRVDSIVVDPHKHGLQPYGCGCVLFQGPCGRAVLQARFALHVFHVEGAAPWARSAWSVRARGRRLLRSGRRKSCFLSYQAVSLRADWRRDARPLRNWIGDCAPTRGLCRCRAVRSWTLWCGQLTREIRGGPQRKRGGCLRWPARAICIWPLYNCRNPG